jgi:hypothetical protein
VRRTCLLEEPVIGCVMTTLEAGNLPRDPSVLRTVVREAAQCVGSYAPIADEIALKQKTSCAQRENREKCRAEVDHS